MKTEKQLKAYFNNHSAENTYCWAWIRGYLARSGSVSGSVLDNFSFKTSCSITNEGRIFIDIDVFVKWFNS